MDNGYLKYNKFSRITMKLINFLKTIIDNGHHNSNKFSRITIWNQFIYFLKMT